MHDRPIITKPPAWTPSWSQAWRARCRWCRIGWTEQVTPLLRGLHWLKVPERIKFRLCVLTHCCLHGTAQPYLAGTLQLTSDMSHVVIFGLLLRQFQSYRRRSTRRSTLGDRTFPMAAGTCLELSSVFAIRAVPSLTSFRRHLKTD